MVSGIADMNFGLGDMNKYTPCHLCAPLAPVNMGVVKSIKIITDNSIETVVFGNTEMNDSLDPV